MDVNLRVILASCEPRIQEPAVPNASLIKSLSSSSSPLPGYNNEVATSSKVQPKNNKGISFGSEWTRPDLRTGLKQMFDFRMRNMFY